MNDELKPCELSDLFINGFRLLDEKEREELLRKVESSYQCWSVDREAVALFLASKTSLFFIRDTDESRLFLLACDHFKGYKQLYWRLDVVLNGKELRCVSRSVPDFNAMMRLFRSYERSLGSVVA